MEKNQIHKNYGNSGTLGSRLRQLRGSWRQIDIAVEINVDESAISRIERDQKDPTFQMAKALCEFYHVSLDYLAYGDKESSFNKESLFSGLSNADIDLLTALRDRFRQKC